MPPPNHTPSVGAPFIAIALIALLVSCQSPSKPLELEETQFSLIPKGSEQARAKEAKNGRQSPYSCLISTLADDEADYNYWNRAFWLEFPEKVIKEAKGKVVMRAIALGSEHAGSKAGSWQGVDNVVRVAQCLIPDSPLAVELLESELRKFSEGTWISNRRGRLASPSTSGWECSEFFVVVSCWGTPTSYHCEVTDVRCVSYIYIEEEPIGGGGGDGFPGEDPGECDPYGAEPCYLGGGGSQPPPEPPNPCAGNPIKNPRIAAQKNSGVNGGRFGYTRSGGNQHHSGLDIANPVESPIYSTHGGQIVASGYDRGGIGYYVTVQSLINGVYHTIQYGHLQNSGRPANGSSVNTGEQIGRQGLSGNLERAVNQGLTVPHVHIIVRQRTGTGWNLTNDYSSPIDPETVITTKFDAQGNPVAETDC
jgi:hypothetical protein